ncbi:hypothetical protein LCGC14_0765230 [marine sediment metagenome]|uniref:ART-PolyVal-like domain-containing protein n=1 Tax=marine sediment metagenome TaxID=412755 RepID=A0A0F9Q082_9ZZZZ
MPEEAVPVVTPTERAVKPITLYHGTSKQFSSFSMEQMGEGAGDLGIPGIYFTENKELAQLYGGTKGHVLTTEVTMTKSYHMDIEDLMTIPVDEEGQAVGQPENKLTNKEGQQLIEQLGRQGYDSIIIDVASEESDERFGLGGEFDTPQYIVFSPEQANIVSPVTPEVVGPRLENVVDYDRRYTLEELREMARQEGLSPSGSKKGIAARLIAKGLK